jgi:hypothetical protein
MTSVAIYEDRSCGVVVIDDDGSIDIDTGDLVRPPGSTRTIPVPILSSLQVYCAMPATRELSSDSIDAALEALVQRRTP